MNYPVTRKEDKIFKGFVFAYVLASFIDLVQTLYGLSIGCIEKNPIVAPISHNLPLFIMVKFIGTALVAWLCNFLWTNHDNIHKAVTVVPKILFGMQFLVVIWNTFVLVLQ